MGDRFVRALIGVLLVAAVATAVGFMAYNAGVAQGLAESGRFAAAPGGAAPYVYVWPRPWGFGFGFFPILVLLLGFFLARRLFWWGAYRGWNRHEGITPRFEEWHRRAHQQDASPGSRA